MNEVIEVPSTVTTLSCGPVSPTVHSPVAKVCAPQLCGTDFTYRLVPVDTEEAAVQLKSEDPFKAEAPPESWSPQLELLGRTCLFMVMSTLPVQIFMEGIRRYPDLPHWVMRRIIRTFFVDAKSGPIEHFDSNELPVPDFVTPSETTPDREETAVDDPILEGIPILEDLLAPENSLGV